MTKRILACLAVCLLLLSSVSCSVAPALIEDETEEEGTTSAEETEKMTEVFPVVVNPLTWEQINAISIASDAMSSSELRQICVDYMRLQLSFQWTPNETFAYTIKTYDKPAEFLKGRIFAGLPYNGPKGGSSGNLYTLMEYYDPATGVLDVKSLGSLRLSEIISNHCSTSCFWAWSRVVNTMKHFSDLNNEVGTLNGRMNQSYGFLPVGTYTYSNVESWYDGDGTKAVCLANGEQTMYESYAQVLPADGCIQAYPKSATSSANHVKMFSSAPVVVRNADGTINPDESYVYVMEQTSSLHPMNQSDGSTVYMEGIADSKTTFKKLFSGYYVPFTFAEFLGLNPVEKGEVLLSSTENLDTVDRLRTVTLTANYPITSLEFRVFSPAGENLYSKILHPAATNSYSWELNSIIYPNMITFLNGSNTLKIFVRLSTGEELEVFQGVVRS